MRRWPAVVALCAIGCASRLAPLEPSPAAAPAPPAAAPGEASRLLRDGVYTAEQSRRGEAIFTTVCARCHRPEMTGSIIVPPLVGQAFLDRWSRRTAGDLFAWVSAAMPPGDAASKLSRPEYADVLSYIFSRNGFPAGSGELAPDAVELRAIRFAPPPEDAGVAPPPQAPSTVPPAAAPLTAPSGSGPD